MTVVTAGPIRVVDACGGIDNGGCEHQCVVTNEGNELCECFAGFEIDSQSPKKCVGK